MPKAEFTYALDVEGNLYACFGRTVKYIFKDKEWILVRDPEEYNELFDYFAPTRFITSEEALKITNNTEPISHYSVHRRVYLTEKEIDDELLEIMTGKKYQQTTIDLIMNTDVGTKVLVLEWLIKSPNAHEITIEMLVRNI